MSDPWIFYKDKEKRINEQHSDLLLLCCNSLENLWIITAKLVFDLGSNIIDIDPNQHYILLYYHKNMTYLIAAFKLTQQGLFNPARAVTRSVYENILRSHLFHHYPEEADLYFRYLQKVANKEEVKEEIKEIKSKGYWSHKYMMNKLYEGKIKERHEGFYESISWFAHPSIKSVDSDFGKIQSAEDTLRGILGFTYDSLEIIELTFQNMLTDELRDMINDSKENVRSYLKNESFFTPNK